MAKKTFEFENEKITIELKFLSLYRYRFFHNDILVDEKNLLNLLNPKINISSFEVEYNGEKIKYSVQLKINLFLNEIIIIKRNNILIKEIMFSGFGNITCRSIIYLISLSYSIVYISLLFQISREPYLYEKVGHLLYGYSVHFFASIPLLFFSIRWKLALRKFTSLLRFNLLFLASFYIINIVSLVNELILVFIFSSEVNVQYVLLSSSKDILRIWFMFSLAENIKLLSEEIIWNVSDTDNWCSEVLGFSKGHYHHNELWVINYEWWNF